MKRLEKLGISPTPWKIDKCSNGWIVVRDAKGKYAATPDGDEETEAISNARLIVIAPELYECLREAIIGMCHDCPNCTGYPEYNCKNKECDCFPARWRAVLTNAAGENTNYRK